MCFVAMCPCHVTVRPIYLLSEFVLCVLFGSVDCFCSLHDWDLMLYIESSRGIQKVIIVWSFVINTLLMLYTESLRESKKLGDII